MDYSLFCIFPMKRMNYMYNMNYMCHKGDALDLICHMEAHLMNPMSEKTSGLDFRTKRKP